VRDEDRSSSPLFSSLFLDPFFSPRRGRRKEEEIETKVRSLLFPPPSLSFFSLYALEGWRPPRPSFFPFSLRYFPPPPPPHGQRDSKPDHPFFISSPPPPPPHFSFLSMQRSLFPPLPFLLLVTAQTRQDMERIDDSLDRAGTDNFALPFLSFPPLPFALPDQQK